MESNKIICPHCGSKNCFHEQIPNELNGPDNVSSYLCMGCGYTTNDFFKTDSEALLGYETTMPALYKDIKFVDSDRNLTWYPTVMNVPTLGMVFVDGSDVTNWKWKAAPAVDVVESEKEKYPIPGKQGEYYTRRIDMTLAKDFEQQDFTEACRYIGLVRTV